MRDHPIDNWKVLLSANNTDASAFDSKVPTTTEPPTGDAVRECKGYTDVLFVPLATAAQDLTAKFRLVGWRFVAGNVTTGTVALWVPTVICEFTATTGNITGVANTEVLATQYFADTITIDNGVGVAFSAAQDVGASIFCDTSGYTKWELVMHRNSSSASVNALYAIQ